MRDPERGGTMCELLHVVMLIGIAVIIMIGLFTNSIRGYSNDGETSAASTEVRNYADAIRTTIATGGYVHCATDTTYAAPAGYRPSAGYTSRIVPGSVQYGASSNWSGTSWTDTCPPELGVQRLTVEVTGPTNDINERLILVVHKP